MLNYKDIKQSDENTGKTLRELLNIKDTNIHFPVNAVQSEDYRGLRVKMIYAVLTYDLARCPHYGMKTIIRHTPKKSIIQLLPFQGNPTFLALFKQRFKCLNCKVTSCAQTYLVEKNCYISKQLKFAIAWDLKNKISMKDIAKRYFVSTKTVERILVLFVKERKRNFNYLPKNLMIDEFKGTKDCEGNMCFIVSDADTGEIFDILDDRRNFKLIAFFERFSFAARKAVQFVVTDMNAAYQSFIKVVFPNAQIIIDRFHVVQQITRAFNKLRINEMNKLKKSDKQEAKDYRKLKKYWKTLLKNNEKIDGKHLKQFPLFQKSYVTQAQVLDHLLDISPSLKEAYEVYQGLLEAFRNKENSTFFALIENLPKSLDKTFAKSITYLKKYKNEVVAALKNSYSNGKLEGTNNLIKVIKRIAFGFRTFKNFKSRILLQQGIFTIAYPNVK